MTNEYLDKVREEFITEWRSEGARTFYVWHREFKDHKDHVNPFNGIQVIVISPDQFWLHHSQPPMWYAPFVYKGAPVKLITNEGWKDL